MRGLRYYTRMPPKHDIPDSAWLLALLMTPGIGVVTLNRVALALKEARIPFHNVVGHTPSMLRKGLPGGLEWAIAPLSCCESATVDRAVFLHERVLNTGGQWLARSARDYPAGLIGVMDYNAPPLLSVYGDIDLLNQPPVSILGSREPTERGRLMAGELAGWAVKHNRVVISGGANGIDLTAHHAALDAGGATAVMIPQGALTYEGPKWLKPAIEDGKACVVSQCIPDMEWAPSGAMGRNRTIAALGQLVCILDPAPDGGSHKTAQFALEYDKRTLVYAYDKVGSAYQNIIRGGAYPILNEHAQWDEAYLEDQWIGGGHQNRKQAELF